MDSPVEVEEIKWGAVRSLAAEMATMPWVQVLTPKYAYGPKDLKINVQIRWSLAQCW